MNGGKKEEERAEAAIKGEDEASLADDVGLDLSVELEAARAEAAEYRERALRAAADAENARRRAEQDIANARKFALERFASEMLPVRDSLERARAVEQGTASPVTEAFLAGVDLTLKLMDSVLEKFSVTVVDPTGLRFNPDQHQAMTLVESDVVPPNHVVEVVQKGFLLHDRLLRPALVVVAKAKTP